MEKFTEEEIKATFKVGLIIGEILTFLYVINYPDKIGSWIGELIHNIKIWL